MLTAWPLSASKSVKSYPVIASRHEMAGLVLRAAGKTDMIKSDFLQEVFMYTYQWYHWLSFFYIYYLCG